MSSFIQQELAARGVAEVIVFLHPAPTTKAGCRRQRSFRNDRGVEPRWSDEGAGQALPHRRD